MLELVPGIALADARTRLSEALRMLTDARGGFTAQDRFNGYLEWVATQTRLCRGVFSPADLDRLITTGLYWSLLGSSPVDLGSAISPTLDGELEARAVALEHELREFDSIAARWGAGRALAVVPDTSVFVEHGAAFPELPWHEILDQRSNVPIHIAVTMAVVRELDGKKLSRDQSPDGQQVRSQVRAALRRIEELFPWNDHQARFDENLNRTYTTLLTDDLGHFPLPDADGEMIRRGLSVLPYAGRAMLVTYDLAQTFRARAAGLAAHRLRYSYEDPQTAE